MHVNPLKPVVRMVANPESGTTVNKKEPMSWKDALEVSLILTGFAYFVYFLASVQFTDVTANLAKFVFDSVKFVGASLFANFLGLSGLSRYINRKNEN